MAQMRIDKYLSHIGVGTRSEVKKLLKQKKVSVNDNQIRDPGFKVNPETDCVMVGQERVNYTEFVYIMLYKPKGVITATEDRHDKTVMDLIDHPMKKKCFPVGRLDKDTTGLLLITNDGGLSHELLSPKKHVDKVYLAYVSDCIDHHHIEAFELGIELKDGYQCLPAGLESIEDDAILSCYNLCTDNKEGQWVKITIREGKFHQIKRMFEALNIEVLELHRHAMGPLMLDRKLAESDFRQLEPDEVKALRSTNR